MAKAIMIQGTASDAGKSFITTGLCRLFAQDGYKIAPFKAQNMALNSYVTKDGYEIGRAQAAQAEAAKKSPDVRMNPILLKPTADNVSQVVLNGKPFGNMSASDYFKKKTDFIKYIKESYESLSAENDIIVIEGAGSPAEINLKQNDIVNMGMAKLAGAPVLLTTDINKGGAFASLYGTVKLLDNDEQKYIKAFIINKFRGDKNLLSSGLTALSEMLNIPFAGVIPYSDIKLDAEDSLALDKQCENNHNYDIDIAVIRLPHISNFTDFEPFTQIEGIRLRYVDNVNELAEPDLIILPGTKNTMGDLVWLKESGIAEKITKAASKKLPIIGICGGYQMLQRSLSDPYNVEFGGYMAGLGLLESETIFSSEKRLAQVNGVFKNVKGVFKELNGVEFKGYEIHMGKTIQDGASGIAELSEGNEIKSKIDGACKSNVYGLYVHGLFDNGEVTERIIVALYATKDLEYKKGKKITNNDDFKESQYESMASLLRNSLDMKMVYSIIEKGVDFD